MTENEKPKTRKTVTIEISTATYDKLCAVRDFLEETFNQHVSFDKCLVVLTAPKLIDFTEIFKVGTPILSNLNAVVNKEMIYQQTGAVISDS